MTTTFTDRISGAATPADPISDLAALEALSGTGFPQRTAENAWSLLSASATKTALSLDAVTDDAQLKASNLDTDGTLAANSDTKIASQKAGKTYADTKLALAGGTLTGQLIGAAGTTSIVPLKFQSGTNLTTAAAGAWEYDGKVAYFSAAASSRQIVVAEQSMRLTATYTLTSQTAAQKLFNTPTNGSVTLQANTTYQFECAFDLTSMSASSGAFGFAFAGTASLTRQKWWTLGKKAVIATAAAPDATTNVAANVAAVQASTATVAWLVVRGILTVGTGGTLIPQVSLGVAAAAVVSTDAYFRIWAVGADSSTGVGNLA